MIFAIVAGLAWGDGARSTQWTTLPALAVIMTLSTLGVTNVSFLNFRRTARPAVMGIVMNFIIHGIVLAGLSFLLVGDEKLWTGLIILAAVPPAVAVIPFSVFLEGDNDYTLVATVCAYLAALVLTPAIALLFLGDGFVQPMKLMVILLELIIAPLVASRVLLGTGLARWVEPVRGPVINWSFFMVIYTMVGLNRDMFLREPASIIPVVIIGIVTTLMLGWVIEVVARFLKVERRRRISLLLLGTFKNYGLAGGLALYFFDEKAAVPATVISVVGILYYVWLQIVENRRKRSGEE